MEAKTANGSPASCFVCETAMPLLERCFGEATLAHFRASRIEFLKGVRSLIDERIAQLSKVPEHKGTHVTVE
jgi:hypothetical protein